MVSFLGVPVKILKAVPTSSILATRSTLLNLLDLITMTILHEWYRYEVPHCEAFPLPICIPNKKKY
jgi:hypothetical protein